MECMWGETAAWACLAGSFFSLACCGRSAAGERAQLEALCQSVPRPSAPSARHRRAAGGGAAGRPAGAPGAVLGPRRRGAITFGCLVTWWCLLMLCNPASSQVFRIRNGQEGDEESHTWLEIEGIQATPT